MGVLLSVSQKNAGEQPKAGVLSLSDDVLQKLSDALPEKDIEAVISFNGRDGEVLPQEEDYAEFYDPIGAAAAAIAAAILLHLSSASHDPAIDQYFIPEGTTVTVPENRQRLVQGPITVDGTIIIDGQEVIL